ncbi:MAG TPA: hypothetical protein VGP93_04500, partial [Polyangiaceae bacterium]|nr:hypothetical protein [Polyangiaceae bacterium]
EALSCEGGMVCALGACVDPCAGAACPGGGACVSGQCTEPTGLEGTAGDGGGIVINPGGPSSGGSSGVSGSGADQGTAANGGAAHARDVASGSNCACRAVAGLGSAPAWPAVAGLALTWLSFRRRNDRRRA